MKTQFTDKSSRELVQALEQLNYRCSQVEVTCSGSARSNVSTLHLRTSQVKVSWGEKALPSGLRVRELQIEMGSHLLVGVPIMPDGAKPGKKTGAVALFEVRNDIVSIRLLESKKGFADVVLRYS